MHRNALRCKKLSSPSLSKGAVFTILITNEYFAINNQSKSSIAFPGMESRPFSKNCSHIYPQGFWHGLFPFSGNGLPPKYEVMSKTFRQLSDH